LKYIDTMGISDLMGFSEKLEEYFEKYKKDSLGNIVYGFYGDYQKELEHNDEITFEDFVLEKFLDYLDKSTI